MSDIDLWTTAVTEFIEQTAAANLEVLSEFVQQKFIDGQTEDDTMSIGRSESLCEFAEQSEIDVDLLATKQTKSDEEQRRAEKAGRLPKISENGH